MTFCDNWKNCDHVFRKSHETKRLKYDNLSFLQCSGGPDSCQPAPIGCAMVTIQEQAGRPAGPGSGERSPAGRRHRGRRPGDFRPHLALPRPTPGCCTWPGWSGCTSSDLQMPPAFLPGRAPQIRARQSWPSAMPPHCNGWNARKKRLPLSRMRSALSPIMREAYFEAGNILKRLGRLDEAEAIFRDWSRVMPGQCAGAAGTGRR